MERAESHRMVCRIFDALSVRAKMKVLMEACVPSADYISSAMIRYAGIAGHHIEYCDLFFEDKGKVYLYIMQALKERGET